jgi:hypothetical protein
MNTVGTATEGVNPGSGHIVALGYYEDSNSGIAPYLYRKTGYSAEQRTMHDNMLFDPALSLSMQGSGINMNAAATTTGGGILNVSGGKLVMNGGTLSMGADAATTGGVTLYMAGGDINNLHNITGATSSMTFTGSLTLNSATSIDVYPNTGGGVYTMNVWGSGPDNIIFAINNGAGRADTFQAQKFIYSSDLSMKENLRPITNALGKILQLRGFNYDWKSGHGHDVGLVAQDVQKVFPELVSKMQGDKLGIDYAKIIAPVVEAIRQLKMDNDALQKKVDALQAQVDSQP